MANRVSEIQALLPGVKWRHVSSHENPADCASRGILPDELVSHELWWSGPPWLKSPLTDWPNDVPQAPMSVSLERKNSPHVLTGIVAEPWELSRRYSSWPKLLRVTAYIIRFVVKLRTRINSTNSANLVPVAPGFQLVPSVALHPTELQRAKIVWLKRMQADAFLKEISCISASAPLPRASSLVMLNPYLDGDGLLRVGGRLRKSDLSEDAKHPIIL